MIHLQNQNSIKSQMSEYRVTNRTEAATDKVFNTS